MNVSIGLTAKQRSSVVALLQVLLADEFVLYTKFSKYHWNVKGPFFGPLHALFQANYEELAEVADSVAERIRALGHDAIGTLAEFGKHTRIKEEPGKNPDAQQMIKQLVLDYETIIQHIRADIDATAEIGDQGTNNFLTDLIEKHEKAVWMLRAHLE